MCELGVLSMEQNVENTLFLCEVLVGAFTPIRIISRVVAQ